MATKANPGRFDCYANAASDEPMFVLLGRDRHAAGLVRLWALLRAKAEEDEDKVEEALECARSMDEFILATKNLSCADTEAPFESLLEAVTAGLKEHPLSYDRACQCDLCVSYGC